MTYSQAELMIFHAIGGLGLFMLGMHFMSDGVHALAAARLREFMERLAGNRILGLLSGAFVTAVVQSSTLVTVMVVCFVASSIITLEQAINLIIGANIGDTITTIIIALPVTKYGLPVTGIAALAYVSIEHEKVRYAALTVMGLGMVFFGLNLLITGFGPIRTMPEIIAFIETFDAASITGILKCVLMGAVLTAIIHSSPAVDGIVMGMAASGILGWQTSLAFVLGSEIGTTFTSILAASTLSINAKRASYAHFAFNVIGVVLAIICFPFLSSIVAFLVGGNPAKPVVLAGVTTYPLAPVAIASFVTCFNILSTVIILPFVPQGARLLSRIGGGKAEPEDMSVPRFLYGKALDEPQMALSLLEKEQNRYRKAFAGFLDRMCRPEKGGAQGTVGLRHALESLHREIIEFGERLCSRKMESETASNVINLVQAQETAASLMQRLSALAELYEQQEPDSPACRKVASWAEALDALLAETVEALEHQDFRQLEILHEMTSDRGPGLETMRRRYIEDGEHYSVQDRQFMIKALGHIEGCIWFLNRLSKIGSFIQKNSTSRMFAESSPETA